MNPNRLPPGATQRWIVAQIGAREHYAVARGLHERGNLESLLTDFWCDESASWLERAPQPLRSLAGRRHPDLPRERVVAFSSATLRQEISQKVRARCGGVKNNYDQFMRVGADFSRRCQTHLQRQTLDPKRHVFFGYNTGCLETLQWLQEKEIIGIVDQIDPARTEAEIVRREEEKWPGWAKSPLQIPNAYFERLSAEWDAASFVIVNSRWAASALEQQGVAPEKLVVIPLAFQSPQAAPSQLEMPMSRKKPLRILWLGTVNLRKGIPYLIEAARQLERAPMEFIVAGPLEIADSVVQSAPSNLQFLGRIARSDAARLYESSDIFVLPTLSDGFAITQLEALAHGLPVVTTSHCGEVVTTGLDGLIVPAGDSLALARALELLEADRDLVREMSRQALIKSSQFSLPRYTELLEAVVQEP